MIKRPIVGLVGAGNIGGTLAHVVASRGLADVVLYDKDAGLAQGKALDISHSLAIEAKAGCVTGTGDFKELVGCQVCVVTAGFARAPGMNRKDLLAKNVAVFQEIAAHIRTHTPLALVVVVTNPLDVMTWVMQKLTGLPHNRVMGMAGALDSGRFASLLAEALDVSVQDIKTMVLGGHGDLMVPLLSATSVQGVPLRHFLDDGALSVAALDALIQRTRDGGAEIVRLLQKSSAYYAPAEACFVMLKALLRNEQRLLPCASWLGDTRVPHVYGGHDLYTGVPAVLGREGVERVWAAPLTADEKTMFAQSVSDIAEDLQSVESLLAERASTRNVV